MSNDLERIEDAVATLLGGGVTERKVIITMVNTIAALPQYAGKIKEDDILKIAKKLETRFDISMGIGSILEGENYSEWLATNRGDIDWYYWKRYKRLLPDKKFAPNVISQLDIVTDKIIDHLENPKKQGQWKRKGLVVGHVQSGKTANYTGVICKAADSGYKVIIVLAGLLKTLRNQTQERIDEGFVGLDSARQLDATGQKEKLVGVGKFDSAMRAPVSLTTSTQDFNKKIATQLGTRIGHFNEPVILVLKKNVSTLKNLIEWLRNNNSDLHGFPMLLIDDEADHASVNTRKADEDPTATNSRIRELLSLFEQSSYLGYTATPFANIFIAPDSEDEMLNDEDLFPRDFIISLDAPSNYVGAKRIFEEDGDLKIVREVNDYEDILPLKHKINEFPEILPASLKEAIRVFILVKAARNLRKQQNSHNSMLVNISRFTAIQSYVKLLIHDYLTELRDAITNHYALPQIDALKNTSLLSLKTTWDKEFSETEFSWNSIQKELKNAVSPISVIEINTSKNSTPLDYSRRDYPNGRNVIAVGGLSLSRGLTFEGLTVSYFLRSSIMYDTLMQMGRWFGYRTDFEKLCRIYMTEEACSWYAHISSVTEELREEFSRMEKAKMTPKDFGLCVRSHPETLIVTASNKMRSGRSVIRQISLEGRLVETSVLLKSRDVIINNRKALEQLIEKISGTVPETNFQPGFLYKNIPVSNIKDFLESFINHPGSQVTERRPLIDYAKWLESKGIDKWDVFLISPSPKKGTLEVDIKDRLHVVAQLRTVSDSRLGNGIELNKRRIGSASHEKAGLEEEKIESAEMEFRKNNPGKSLSGSIYREKRTKPLLMLHVLDCRKDGDILFPEGVIAYGISFPGEAVSRRAKKLVEYVVNTVWWSNNYADLLDEDEADDIDE
ncbi:Z1 domain-containing protein [Methylobacter svalbardensis]|uniref:Z1 domain-containing protein n=1 Tax=Methylobacter svalbardensis TaxID=3080016 RepID=UPI0030ED0EB9